ncbi:MAG: AI-2E family transporter, partial [Lachnospiraceae bacterium]|nr:AI-2E family transporter [Lachnospiraceae bacterium]
MKNQKWYPFAVALCVAILFYVALSRFDVVLSGAGSFLGFIRPVLISLAIAYVLDPLVMFFERTIFSKLKSEQLSRNFSVLLMVISVAVMIAILMIVMIPPLVSSITSLMTNLRNYTGTFSDMLEQLQESAAVVHLDLTKVTKGLISYINNFANQLPENLS